MYFIVCHDIEFLMIWYDTDLECIMYSSIDICRYLHAFEDFYRKLGSTMGTISRPGRNRHDSGRSILNFRGREKEALAREVIAKEAAKELEKVCIINQGIS